MIPLTESSIVLLLRRLFSTSFSHLLPREAINEWIERNVRVGARVLKVKNQAIEVSTADYLKTRFCSKPFEHLETSPSGLLYVCCPGWLPMPIGDVNSNIATQWSGAAARRLRESIADGSFGYCDHKHCPSISGRTLPARESPQARAYLEGERAAKPKDVFLSHDRSCNLSCPSCRKDMIVANKSKQKALNNLIEDSFIPVLQEAKDVWITGSGDPFASNHFRSLIKRLNAAEFPDLTINLITNGQLWDRRAWNDLDLSGRVGSAAISIDAARPETYRKVRRGGDFARLLRNLDFIRSLRADRSLRRLAVAMVVQADNFREIPDFVKLGKEFMADTITFQMIRNWGTYSRDEFRDVFIGDPSHPDFAEFCEVLKAPELLEPEVEAGNIFAYADRALARH